MMQIKKTVMPVVLALCCTLWSGTRAYAQPYVDPVQVRYMRAFRNNSSPTTPFTHLWAGSDLPLKLKEGTYLLLSPYYEKWRIDSANREAVYPSVQSLAFPVGLILPLNTRWALTVMPTLRTNGETLLGDKTMQLGAATFASWARKPQQKFRFGVYVNGEFFGLFVMPLVGTDWRIDNKNYLFGILPGRLTWEHQWSRALYGGATFRAITTSYRLTNGQFLRLDDNQLSLYLDYYFTKHVCFTLEPGYGLLRKLRTGTNSRDYLTKSDWGDGPFIKLSTSYRVRL